MMKNKDIDVAESIVMMIMDTDTDVRGEIFRKIGNDLRSLGQGYTGSLFEKIGRKYGVPEEQS